MKFSNFDTFSFVDVETTGTSASQDRVLEIGIIRVQNGEIVGSLNTLIDAGVYIPPEITGITGITEKDILNAPTFPDVADKVEELLKDSVFVAHNARFDHAFIKHEFRRLGLPFNPKTLDTVKLSRRMYPFLTRHNLDSIISFLNVKIEHRHRAYDDAYVLYEFLKRIHSEFPKEITDTVFKEFLKSPSLPQNISKEQINTLPETPGVYIMYGENDTLLYIGKSVDIRGRVLSHFYNDFDSQTDLKLNSTVRRVEALKTAGDMGASLLESHLIKTNLPIYNKALRKSKGILAAVEVTKKGYLSIEIMPLSEIKHEEVSKILFVSNSNKQLLERIQDSAKEFKLCLKLLGLEKGSGRCFGCQIERCNGACIGEEPAFKYNTRFIEAFYKSKVKDWPFNGPIGIKEKFEDMEEIHVINNWCLIGTVQNENDSVDEVLLKTPDFSWDNYKIINRFVKKHAKNNSIINFKTNPDDSSPKEPL